MDPLIAIALLIVLAVACALALRSVACPGWALLGGVLAGVLLGPTLFGRVMPISYESIFIGGVEQREQLQQLQGRYGADVLAAEHAGAESDVLDELHSTYLQQRSAAEHALMQARWDHQLPQRTLAVVSIVLVLWGSRWMHPAERHSVEHGTIAPMTIGLWAAAVPGALAVLFATWWWQQDIAQGALLAGAVMVGPWALTPIDRRSAQHAEVGGAQLIQIAGRFASIAALLTATWAVWSLRGTEGLLWMLPAGALILAWLPKRRARARSHVQAVRSIIHIVLIPVLAASVAVKIELYGHFAIWPILGLLILSGDGRWIGAVTGAMLLGGRSFPHAMKLTLGSMACGPTQLAFIAIIAHAWMLEISLVFALLVGAVYIEVSVPLRRWCSRELNRASEL